MDEQTKIITSMGIENEFIPYEQALALKELGFDKPCFGLWTKTNNQHYIMYAGIDNVCIAEENNGILSPLYQQAFNWFREKYQFDSFCRQFNLKGKSYWKITKIETVNKIKGYSNFSSSYKQSQLNCLKKLIKLCQK